jgi:hypothetical protein
MVHLSEPSMSEATNQRQFIFQLKNCKVNFTIGLEPNFLNVGNGKE